MLKAIFYAHFHFERGQAIAHQHPADVALTVQSNATAVEDRQSTDSEPLINFQDIKPYIIPSYELCNQPLSVVARGRLVLGWPVSIEGSRYARNHFIFNVCFVLEENIGDDVRRAWEGVVRKTAKWFKRLESDDAFLSASEGAEEGRVDGVRASNGRAIGNILQQIYEQLDAYGECCARLSDEHVLNLRLDIPKLRVKQSVKSWDVPLLIAELPGKDTWTWDLVLERISTYINGVNHVRKIGELADVEIELVCETVEELVHHGFVMLLDVFHFQGIYAPTDDMAWFVRDQDMLAECCDYITTEAAWQDPKSKAVAEDRVIELYSALKPGVSVGDFYITHQRRLRDIDIRRFITFGVIKGFLRRMQKFALLAEQSSVLEASSSRPQTSVRKPHEDAVESFERAWRKAALSSGWATPPADLPVSLKTQTVKSEEVREQEEDERLQEYLEEVCCLDRICVEMRMSEKKVVERLKSGRFGEVIIFAK